MSNFFINIKAKTNETVGSPSSINTTPKSYEDSK